MVNKEIDFKQITEKSVSVLYEKFKDDDSATRLIRQIINISAMTCEEMLREYHKQVFKQNT